LQNLYLQSPRPEALHSGGIDAAVELKCGIKGDEDWEGVTADATG